VYVYVCVCVCVYCVCVCKYIHTVCVHIRAASQESPKPETLNPVGNGYINSKP
jgi:hypothetical protein